MHAEEEGASNIELRLLGTGAEREAIGDGLAAFRAQAASCSDAGHRRILLATIGEGFGGLEAFDKAMRRVLLAKRDEAQQLHERSITRALKRLNRLRAVAPSKGVGGSVGGSGCASPAPLRGASYGSDASVVAASTDGKRAPGMLSWPVSSQRRKVAHAGSGRRHATTELMPRSLMGRFGTPPKPVRALETSASSGAESRSLSRTSGGTSIDGCALQSSASTRVVSSVRRESGGESEGRPSELTPRMRTFVRAPGRLASVQPASVTHDERLSAAEAGRALPARADDL